MPGDDRALSVRDHAHRAQVILMVEGHLLQQLARRLLADVLGAGHLAAGRLGAALSARGHRGVDALGRAESRRGADRGARLEPTARGRGLQRASREGGRCPAVVGAERAAWGHAVHAVPQSGWLCAQEVAGERATASASGPAGRITARQRLRMSCGRIVPPRIRRLSVRPWFRGNAYGVPGFLPIERLDSARSVEQNAARSNPMRERAGRLVRAPPVVGNTGGLRWDRGMGGGFAPARGH